MKNKRKNFLFVILTLIVPFVLSVAGCGSQEEYVDEVAVIKTYDDLGKAINEAKDGDVIYVDDIDFTPLSASEFVTNKKKTIEKSITIKSGKKNESAIFTNGMFLVSGSKITGEKSCVSFENIVFDGTIDTENMTAENCPDEGFYSHAIDFLGNVDCEFINCKFTNYYSSEGGVIEVRYGDYTADDYKRNLYQDQSNCSLNLTFDNCEITKNCAFYTAGAFLIESNKNVTLNMTDCVFSNNKSGAYYGMGGGAIYGVGATLHFKGCSIINNQCNYCYPKIENYYPMDSLSDNARGGGIYLTDCSLNMTDCLIANNVGTMGGGIALTNTDSDFDGCTFAKNKANRCSALENDDTIAMPCSLGQGGAMYIDGGNYKTVSLINCYVCDNSADIAYGGIFQFYNGPDVDPLGLNYLNLNCCSYTHNGCDSEYDYSGADKVLWNNVPGDIWTDPTVSVFGSVIIDDTFETTFVKNEKPTKENGYNYIASLSQATLDGVEVLASLDDYKKIVKTPSDAKWQIPESELAKVVGDRYNGKSLSGAVGSNYKKELYGADNGDAVKRPSKVWVYAIIGVSAVVVAVGFVGIILLRKRRMLKSEVVATDTFVNNGDGNQSVTAQEQSQTQKYIIVRYSEEQVEEIMTKMAEVQSFTNRERDVFREMLLGKKQTEIAEKLFISTSTVKDFYQKIYSKMGVDNKDALLKKICEEMKK